MQLPSFAQIVRSARNAPPPCVSLYLPTHESGRETLQGPTRLKTLLRQGRRDADLAGFDAATVAEITEPAAALVDDYDFWQHQRQGLGLLLATGVRFALRVPFEVPELAVVGAHLHVSPLLPLHDGIEFRLLCLSQDHVRLYECDAWGQRELAIPELPTDAASARASDGAEPTLQLHTFGLPHAQRALFHGHGASGKEERDEADRVRFLRLVDDALDENAGQATPLVVAGLAELVATYRRVTHRPDIVAATIPGNPDGALVEDLHAEARRLLAPRHEAQRQRAIDDHLRLAGTDLTTDALETIVRAARNGRVRDLFVVPGRHAWGRPPAHDAERIRAHAAREPGDVDLLDGALMDTLAHGGTVHKADRELMGTDAAATLRY